ncbi:MAG: hypothetical protein ACRDYV_02170 [Acidimicrobiia bacterium]
MSFRRLLDRTVTIVPRVVTGVDGRGNDIVTDGTPIPGVPAGRDLLQASEEITNRDQQAKTFVYFLPPTLDDGTAITLTGYDRIVDDGKTFEVRGEPDQVVRRRGGRLHHLEAIAYLIEG